MGLYVGAENFLYLGKRRVSRGVFRQLRRFGEGPGPAEILSWVPSGGFEFTRPVVGVVNYHWSECKTYEEHLHVVIQPGHSPDDLCPLWVQQYEGWLLHVMSKECGDFAGQVRYRQSNPPAEVERLEEVRVEWSIFYDKLARLPVLYIGG